MRHLQIILLFALILLFGGISPVSAQNTLFTSENAQTAESSTLPESKITFTTGMKKLVFSVAAVTLLFMVLLLVLKKFSPGGAPQLPKDVFEVLGKSPLAFRQQLYLLRCGKKIFIVSLSQNGLDRVGEIDDPAEVERLAKRCSGEIPDAENAFREWKKQGGEKA
ncbi:MAG: flagellar biosynthetic protein FliO [Thermoguttaceae bacterium]|nr:flagellar biosynthetic protein FliO [Thermoguttaceae bacterium]MDO4856875.1 flagellar biosynthetic protein FliO [Thermoguttaceae bacterium]